MFSWKIYEFFRSTRRRCFMKKAVPKYFAIFTGKLQACNFIKKRDSNTDVFLSILRNFWEHLFWRTFTNGYFCFLKKLENSGEQLFCINRLWATKPLTTQSKFINLCFVSKRFIHVTYKVQSRFGNLIF